MTRKPMTQLMITSLIAAIDPPSSGATGSWAPALGTYGYNLAHFSV